MNPVIAAAIAALGLALSPAIGAEEPQELIDASSPTRIQELIQALGYRAVLSDAEKERPVITSSVGGTEFSIVFSNCSENKHDDCTVLLFRVGYDLNDGSTPESINQWNRGRLIGRAYLDDDSDPWLEWAINLDGGVSRKNFADSFDWWEVVVQDFENHIDY